MFRQPFLILLAILLMYGHVFGQSNGKTPGFTKEIQTDQSKLVPGSPHRIAAPSSEKTDPLLREVIRIFANQNLAPAVKYRGISSIVSLRESEAGVPDVGVLIKSLDLAATEAAILSVEGKVSTVNGDIFTASLPVTAIEAVAMHAATHSMQASTQSRALMNISGPEVSADAVHSGVGLDRPYTGYGVVVGVLDSGIDWKHVDFDWFDGSTRIQYLWDMSGNTNPPAGYSYGREYTKANIDANQCFEIDGDGGFGHGTHVTGTAAGSGFAGSGYNGIAPESDIIFVKGIRDHNSNGGFSDADIIDGCNYIFSKAAALGKPAVINLSLGGHVGAHDGTSLYEQALDFQVSTGNIIVAAAGNQGGDYIHLSYGTQPGSSYSDALETIWTVNEGSNYTAVDMWYDSGNISVGIAAYDIYGQLIGYTNPVAPGGMISNLPFQIYGYTYGLVSIDAQTVNDPNNGASRVTLSIDGQNGSYPIGQVFWSLYTFGTGVFDAWLITGGKFTTDSEYWYRPGDNFKSVASPSTANNIICVGSYVTKNQWVDINGYTQNQLDNQGNLVTVGDISWFSSIGPSRDGRQKPDISAPGEAILSALSSDLTIGNGVQLQNILFTGLHAKQQGTSMASPHVAGAVGLLLERYANLTVADVRQMLKNGARTDGFTGTVPNATFGHGKLDVWGAISTVPLDIESGDSPIPADFNLEQNYPNPFNPTTHFGFQIVDFGLVRINVYDIRGMLVRTIANREMTPGRYEASWDGLNDAGQQVASGVYFYRLVALSANRSPQSAIEMTRKMLLVR